MTLLEIGALSLGFVQGYLLLSGLGLAGAAGDRAVSFWGPTKVPISHATAVLIAATYVLVLHFGVAALLLKAMGGGRESARFWLLGQFLGIIGMVLLPAIESRLRRRRHRAR